MVVSKFPKEKLELGAVTTVSEVCKCIKLYNQKCLIEGNSHEGKPTNYIEMTRDCIALKCSHDNCFGKLFHKQFYMTKQETNMVFNGNNILNINVNNVSNDNDDSIEFKKIDVFDDVHLNDLVYIGLSGKPLEHAEIVYYLNKDKYVYADNNLWYMYVNRWIEIGSKNQYLRADIVNLKKIYLELKNKYMQLEKDSSKFSKIITQIIKNFSDTVVKNNIMTELLEFYSIDNRHKTFLGKLDNNKNLIGFNNGVYDLQKFEFREGKYDDFISITTGYNYISTHTDKCKELLQFLEDIQPNKEEREYMLTYLSIGLIGNKLELFTILTGCGRNGKSKLIELLKCTFGDYFGSVQSQMFTRPRPNAESPDPGLLNLLKKRIVIASEPEKNAKLNSGFIKFITGRDSTTLRTCHSNDMIDFTANFITLLICNDIPDCDDSDNAFSKRLRCINFPTEFVDKPTKEHQKKINANINNNFEYWKSDFMLLLIDYYKKYIKNDELCPTENILKWTNQYKEDTDLYLQFINDCTEEGVTHVKTMDIYERFKSWFKINNPYTKIPSNREFISNLKKHKTVEHIRIDKNIYYGVKNLKLIEY
jgi:P4 family phage/plasmid primase-like protien